jgi:hypothetical protein
MIKFEKDEKSPTTDKVVTTTPCVQSELLCCEAKVLETRPCQACVSYKLFAGIEGFCLRHHFGVDENETCAEFTAA